jgi:hypothetical protein
MYRLWRAPDTLSGDGTLVGSRGFESPNLRIKSPRAAVPRHTATARDLRFHPAPKGPTRLRAGTIRPDFPQARASPNRSTALGGGMLVGVDVGRMGEADRAMAQ